MAPTGAVLAIHEDTNANAALLRDGRIVAAVAEERLTRTKYQAGFPERAVDEVLRIGGMTLDTVDTLVAGNRYHFAPRVLGSASIEGEHDLFGLRHRGWMAAQKRFTRGGLAAKTAHALGRAALGRRFGRAVHFADHHTAHAYSAYLTSGFDDALAISIDNLGDGYAARTFRCRDGRCQPLWASDATCSPGQFYGEVAQYLGFHVLMAGKVTGLAARGNPKVAYEQMEQLFWLDRDDTNFRLASSWLRSRRRGPFKALEGMSREDIAAAAQARLEDLIVRYAARALRETGDKNLVLAGGVFANVLVNQKLWKLPPVEGLFVHPAMSDQGIASGAALTHLAEAHRMAPSPIADVYLGPGYEDDAIGELLEREQIRAERCEDIDGRVAKLLIAGKVVARFAGRMEYGPRALGHRSILYGTADPTVNEWLNRRLKRSEFMPFAPATLAEYAGDCYADYGPGVAHTTRFMTLTLDCTDDMKRLSPAVVHIDGTARPQVVHEAYSPGFHRIISLVHEETGVPSVVNTSFNMHGEPIVCTPSDAVRSFQAGDLDALALGSFLLTREPTTPG